MPTDPVIEFNEFGDLTTERVLSSRSTVGSE